MMGNVILLSWDFADFVIEIRNIIEKILDQEFNVLVWDSVLVL